MSNAHEEFDALLYDAEAKAKQTRERLEHAATELSERMARVAEKVRDGGSVNALGEVQGRGAEVDRLCAELDLRSEHLNMVKLDRKRAQGKVDPDPVVAAGDELLA